MLMISPKAHKGFIDYQVLSFDADLKLIEDVFLGGQRLDPGHGWPLAWPGIAPLVPGLHSAILYSRAIPNMSGIESRRQAGLRLEEYSTRQVLALSS